MNEDLKALFEGQDFTQEFKDKVSAIFESALEEKTEQIEAETKQRYSKLSEQYAEYVVEETENKADQYITEHVMPMVEKYLDYSVSEFMIENKLSVESGTKVDLAEQFLSGLSGAAQAFNVTVPEGKDDYITEMEASLQSMQDRFDRVLSENAALEQEITTGKMSDIVDAKVSDLTESQKEKFFRVASKVTFQDEEQYAASIDDLYESYFPTSGGSKLINEGGPQGGEPVKSTATPEGSTWAEQLLSRI